MAEFRKASKAERKLRLAITGPSGSGKTWLALRMARLIVGEPGRIAVIDSEQGSSQLYVDQEGVGSFGVCVLDTYSPADYIDAMVAAYDPGKADITIIDSASHEWMGPGGVLQIVDDTAEDAGDNNKFRAWGVGTKAHNRFLSALLKTPYHLIVTVRSKTAYAQEKDPTSNRTVIRKLGLQPIQRDGFEYEFDLVGNLDDDHTLTISKSRVNGIDTLDTFTANETVTKLAPAVRAWLLGE